MRPLELDFRRTRRASSWAGTLLLAVAIAFIADLGVSYHEVRQAIAAKEARLAKLARTARAAAAPADLPVRVSAEEIVFARATIQRLSMPWNDLFGALESTLTHDVALLAIEPDPRSGTVMISGKSKDYAAALDYVSKLARADALGGVHLVKHDMRKADLQQPVAFSISATWGAVQ